jgi:hypothetical protein
MNTNLIFRISKIGILILITLIGSVSCKNKGDERASPVIRFEKLVFTIPAESLADTIYLKHPNLVPFFQIFNEEVIGIGPDSLPGYTDQLGRFTSDSLIRQIYREVDESSDLYLGYCRDIDQAMNKLVEISGLPKPDAIVTYLSGFNQSFVTLPGILGIGLDSYLGSESPYYQGLRIPEYIRKNMNPENLPADAVRAWLYGEIPGPAEEGGFLDRMIFEGKLNYIAKKILPKVSEENLFHYTEQKLQWCKEQEKAMWKYLAEQKILFSTDRLTIRKFMDEAPFTRDFGNESPGRVGTWIGYRVVSSYMKASGVDIQTLIGITNPKEILSGSKYHP